MVRTLSVLELFNKLPKVLKDVDWVGCFKEKLNNF